MDILFFISIAIGGGFGALTRYAINLFFSKHFPYSFPFATLCANVTGCILMGLFFGLLLRDAPLPIYWQSFITNGFLGSLTTFSTFSFESFSLWANGEHAKSILNILINLILGLSFSFIAFLGVWL